MKNQKNKTETTNPWEEDCPTDCECYDDPPKTLVGNNVYTNTNGSSGPSDHMKELMTRAEKKVKKTLDIP